MGQEHRGKGGAGPEGRAETKVDDEVSDGTRPCQW